VHHHEVEHSLVEVVKYDNLHCLEEVGLQEVTHDTGNVLEYIAYSGNMARHDFGIGCLCVGYAERCPQVVILPEVFLVRIDLVSKFVPWTLAPKTDMPL